jgi:hypothetical protein
MRALYLRVFSVAAGGFLVGCGSPSEIVPAHQLQATVVVNGVTTHAVLSFPDHDGAALHHPGDSTCSLNTGSCSQPGASDATCIVNVSIGKPVPCDYAVGDVTLTLSPE